MSEHDRPLASLLDLIAEPGVLEILLVLREREGTSTVAQLRAAGATRRDCSVRRLVAAGYVSRLDSGTLDAELDPDTTIMLTPAGRGLSDVLAEINKWAQQHAWQPESPQWWHRALARITKLREVGGSSGAWGV